jgi:SAM-dependent methyltransferase
LDRWMVGLTSELNPDEAGYVQDHRVRYTETLRRFWRAFDASRGGKVLCLGGKSHFELWLGSHFGFELEVYGTDLRLPFSLAPRTFDLVLMLEVIEHLYDVPSRDTFSDEFHFTGMHSCLSESYRVLASGGFLCLSTPNIVSLDAIGQACLGLTPFQYTPHVRELTPSEVRNFLGDAGFAVVACDTAFVWNPVSGVDRLSLLNMLSAAGFDTSDRGDDIFALGQAVRG